MSTFTPPALHGIIGYPLGHSMSPLMHNTAFRTLNLPGVYLSWPIEPGRLPAFVDAARLLNIRGCSITIPHKIDIIPLLDKTSENVREMGACNTLYRDGEKICGENTDVIGFTAPLRKRSLSPETRVLVLGAGGVSRAAIAGLRRLGLANITLTNRRAFQDNGIAYDLIYTPFQTRFLRDAAAAGWETVSGLDMFIGQGDAQFHRWTGHHLPEEAITAVTSALYGQ